ncbi:MAG: VOC family protein [Rhodospirillales bacterium]|nr:VOC family protein [Rhodospirillales bacterium]MCW9003509.1 VOC family protein [Rhodospirillales bacterium]
MELDHIAIAATSLEAGADYLKERLGVDIPAGGEHTAMGTHNRLMRLGPGLYLEVIAIAPHLPAPSRPRWFALDDQAQRGKLAERPRLTTWIARTPDIEGIVNRSPVPLGVITPMQRGDLSWRITVPDDGSLPDGGALPVVIQWPEGPHPSDRMADLGCRLNALKIYHPQPGVLLETLRAIGADGLVSVEAAAEGETPWLMAEIETPRGIAILT